jgi:chromosome segregation ATPase
MQFDDFLKVVDLLKDPAQYEAKVAELQAREDAINAAIKQMGVVDNVLKAQAQADAKLAQAQAAVADATKQAQAIITGAQTAFDKRNTELQAREVVADQALADYNTIKNQLAFRSNELSQGEKSLNAARVQLQADLADLASKQQEVDARLAKLREAMG